MKKVLNNGAIMLIPEKNYDKYGYVLLAILVGSVMGIYLHSVVCL